MGGDMLLSTDGQRVIVETADSIVALHGQSGAEAWSLPLSRVKHLRALPRRAFVGSGRVLVARESGALARHDTSTGALLKEVPSPGRTIKDAVVRRDTFVVSVEDEPGKAFVAAIDATGAVAWKRDVFGSVARIRGLEGDEPSTVYVLDGNARIAALDERTGAEKGGLSARYVLKPFDEERLTKALFRARERLSGLRGSAEQSALLEHLGFARPAVDRLVIHEAGRALFVPVDTIDWLEAAGKYVAIHADKATHLLRESISALEAQLDPRRFLRIHRGTIVRVDRIREVRTLFGGEYLVVLQDGTELGASRGYRDRIQALLGKRPSPGS